MKKKAKRLPVAEVNYRKIVRLGSVGPTRSWWVRFVAANGEILAHSESYHRKIDAVKCAKFMTTFRPWRLVVPK